MSLTGEFDTGLMLALKELDVVTWKNNGAKNPLATYDLHNPVYNYGMTCDYEVFFFPQTWVSTAGGYGGIGGASITTGYTMVVHSDKNGAYVVCFGGRVAYIVTKPTVAFLTHLGTRNLMGRTEYMKNPGLYDQDFVEPGFEQDNEIDTVL